MAAETWHMNDPRRPHPERVVLDDDSVQVLEDAIYQLGIYRMPMGYRDGLLRVHALATLIAQADTLMADAVADARDQDHPWPDIAAQLGVTTQTARRRYSRHHRTRSVPIELD
jgi:hypothetical protein